MHLNTAVSSLMELVNELYAFSEQSGYPVPSRSDTVAIDAARAETLGVVREAVDALVLMLSPFAPHVAEELWQKLGRAGELSNTAWPSFDAGIARAEELIVPVQIG